MTEQPTLTITLPVNSVDIGGALDAARALTAHLEAAQEMLGRLAALVDKGYAVTTPAPVVTPVATPPVERAAAETPQPPVAINGHRKIRAPSGRRYTDEEKAAIAARAHEVGINRAAEEAGVSWGSAKAWADSHPKEHAVADPIVGTPPRVGENREDWEARHRAAAAAAS